MRKLIGAIIALVSVLASTSAFARPHHARHYTRHVVHQTKVAQPAFNFPDIFKMPIFSDVADYSPMHSVRARIARTERTERRHTYLAVNPREHEERSNISFSSEAPRTSEARPGDCYGIQWCGCYMRHLTGLRDSSLNLAANWAHVGAATSAHSGAIVVWRHHVGELKSEVDEKGYAMVLSGNNGSGNRATVRYQRVRNAIAFRQL